MAGRSFANRAGKDRDAIMAKMDSYAAGGAQDVMALKGSDVFRLRHGDWRAVAASYAFGLAKILDQAGMEFIDEGDAIGVRVVRWAKPGTHELKKRKPRSPKKPAES